MGVLDPYFNAIDHLKGNIENVAKEAVLKNIDEILKLNKQQLMGSIGANGKRNPRRYAESTENYWRYADPPQDPSQKVQRNKYNFFWSGETQREMYVKVNENNSFSIFSEGGKAKFIESFYAAQGFKMFGLTPKHNKYINEEIILPYLRKYILDYLFKV